MVIMLLLMKVMVLVLSYHSDDFVVGGEGVGYDGDCAE